MPATFEFDNGVAVAITEAAIRDYAGMYLVKEKGGLVGKLSPKLGQEKIKVETDSFPAPHTVARNLRCRPGGRIAGDEYTNKPERALQD